MTMKCLQTVESPHISRHECFEFNSDCIDRMVQKMQGPRKFMTADGEVRFGNPVQLSEFLSEMHL